MTVLRSGFQTEQREKFREELLVLAQAKAAELNLPEEAVVQEIRYWQQSVKKWATNPKKSDRKKSYNYHSQTCAVCNTKILTLNEATFHHLKRGIRQIHSPENMIPLHKDGGCHEKLHDAPPGSFVKGSKVSK